MKAIERPIVTASGQIPVDRATGRQILGDGRPLAAGAEDIENAIDDFTNIDLALVPARLGGWDQRPDQGPFVVRQVARIPQFAAVIAASVVSTPHGKPPGTSQSKPSKP